MNGRRERGFTLIEVVVAFAIFALCIGPLYETFSGSMRRSGKATTRELSWLTARSLLSALRVTPAPWPKQKSGRAEGGLRWSIDVEPDQDGASAGRCASSGWCLFHVSVHVGPEGAARGEVVLESVEFTKAAS